MMYAADTNRGKMTERLDKATAVLATLSQTPVKGHSKRDRE